jgi:hypothetical protein
MSEANTIWVKAYTPDGEQMNITFGFENGNLIPAAEIKRRVLEAGYLLTMPGAKAGEDVEVITHVMKRLQFNKKDNSTTPCIGFYHESPGLVFAYWNHYLNSPADIADFEAVAGIKVDSIPLLEDAAFPKRDDHFKQKYLVQLPRPLQARFTKEKYLKEDGKESSRPKTFEGFIGGNSHPASGNDGKQGEPVIMWTQDEQKSFWQQWNGDKQIAKGVILDVLGVKALGEFKNSLARANTLMEMETRPKASGQ